MKTRQNLARIAVKQTLVVLLAGVMMMSARADDHVLPLAELNNAISRATTSRQANRADIDRFFSEPRVQHVLKDAGLNAQQLKNDASLMSDEEQASLAARCALRSIGYRRRRS